LWIHQYTFVADGVNDDLVTIGYFNWRHISTSPVARNAPIAFARKNVDGTARGITTTIRHAAYSGASLCNNGRTKICLANGRFTDVDFPYLRQGICTAKQQEKNEQNFHLLKDSH